MTIDFLIGAIRASRDLHPKVKTELEEILHRAEPVKAVMVREEPGKNEFWHDYACPFCKDDLAYPQKFCSECGRQIVWK